MVAILSHIIPAFKSAFTYLFPTLSSYTHPWNIPLPSVIHRVMDNDFLSKYEEILIIGDVHGCYDELRQLIYNAHDDDIKDSDDKILKIFVGDLVNKGPKSKEILNYLMSNDGRNCYSVRGNHDEVVIREWYKYHRDRQELIERNNWIKDLTSEQINYLVSLPYTIRLPLLNMIVVHAGLIPYVLLEDQTIQDMVSVRNVITVDGYDFKGTKSHDEGTPWAQSWSGPEHVYFGHDAQRKLQKYEHCTGLDTGCVYGGTLTAVFAYGPRKGEFIEVYNGHVYNEPKGPRI